MPFYDLLLYIPGNINLFLLICFLAIMGYYIIFRKHIYSIFDPLIMILLGECAGSVVVIFMYIEMLIDKQYFVSYVITQIAFILGFLSINPIDINKMATILRSQEPKKLIYSDLVHIIYLISSLTYVCSQLVVYYVAGIPLFYISRLDVYIGGGGFGILGRVIYITSTISLVLLLFRMLYVQRKDIMMRTYDNLLLIFILLTAILSGSKATFLSLVFVIFYINLFSLRLSNDGYFVAIQHKVKKLQWMVLCMAFIAALAVIYIQSKYSDTNPIISLLVRIVGYGDVFVMGYPNNVIEHLPPANPLMALFSDFLGFFRIVPWDDLPMALGAQIYRYVYPNTDFFGGGNAKHNIFGLLYFGFYGSIIFSYILGWLMSFIRNKLYFIVPNNIVGEVIYILIVTSLIGLSTDVVLALYYLDNIIFIFIPIMMVAYIIVNSGTDYSLMKNRDVTV